MRLLQFRKNYVVVVVIVVVVDVATCWCLEGTAAVNWWSGLAVVVVVVAATLVLDYAEGGIGDDAVRDDLLGALGAWLDLVCICALSRGTKDQFISQPHNQI
jgi:hypothetical protein